MLTELERKRVLYHLDYALLSLPTTLGLGLPIVTQARFIVEQNMLHVDAASEPLIREVMGRLDCIVRETDQARAALVMSRTGETYFREDAIQRIDLEYAKWVTRLADMLGAQRNPVSNAATGQFGGVMEGF
jgi:hypothetical protein